MTWAATLCRSEPKEGRDTRLLAVIGFPHAKDVTIRATRRVAHHNHPIVEHPETDHPNLAVLFATILRLEVRAGKDLKCILEVEAAIEESLFAFLEIVCDAHTISVATSTFERKEIVGVDGL